MTGVSAQHTSVPRWPASPPCVDAGGREFYVIALGEAAGRAADHWSAVIMEMGRPLRRYGADDAPAWLATQLAVARVGVRVMLAGPELEVLDLLRTARAAAMIDAEIRMWVAGSERRRVYCPHCASTTEAEVAVGEGLPCAGCGRQLVVYHHVARAHGAYLGYMADAGEEDAA